VSLVRNGPPLNRTTPDQPKRPPNGGVLQRTGNLPSAEALAGGRSHHDDGRTTPFAPNAAKVAISVFGDLATIEPDWRLFEQTADRTAFQAFDWIAKWQTHIGSRRGAVPAIVTGRAPDGTLLFLLPLAVEPGRLTRRLTWLASELCDYNAPLLAPSFPETNLDWTALWPLIVKAIRSGRHLRFDLIDLQKMPERVGDQPNPMLTLGVTRHPDDAHVATLGSDWDSFYRTKRSSSTRKVQRKHLNRLADHGALDFVDSREPAEITRTLDTLMEQKRRALTRIGVGDMFARPGMRDFYLAVAHDPNMAGWVHVSRLDIGPDVGATSVGLLHAGRYYLILSSYNDGPLSNHGPGRAHLHELLRYAIEHGFGEFDFTIGNEPYKLDWSDIRVALYDHLSSASFGGALTRPAVAAFRGTKRFIKNNPAAWHTYEAMRSWFGGRKKSAAQPRTDKARNDGPSA
jgi:CelD/BcsL family acetyltransferase involved in cellulose biosynthesis